jgi:hypothetical protein
MHTKNAFNKKRKYLLEEEIDVGGKNNNNNNNNIGPANVKLGAGDGNLFNPAAENNEGGQGAPGYVGYKYGKNGAVVYDDDAVAAKIERMEQFVDAFQNTYVPQERRGKFFGYYVKDPVGKTQYLLRDPSNPDSGFKWFSRTNAYKNAVGKAKNNKVKSR